MSIPTPVEVLRAYESWEADLITSTEAWGGGFPGGMRDLPTFTEELWDRLMVIQDMRNRALVHAEAGTKQDV